VCPCRLKNKTCGVLGQTFIGDNGQYKRHEANKPAGIHTIMNTIIYTARVRKKLQRAISAVKKTRERERQKN